MIMRKYFLMLGRNKATVVYGCLWVWLAPDDLSHHLLWLVHNRALWTWWFKAKHVYYPHSFSGSGVWARLPWSLCSVSHKAEMRALARLCFPSEALPGNVDWGFQDLLNPVYSVRTSLLTGRAFQALQTAYSCFLLFSLWIVCQTVLSNCEENLTLSYTQSQQCG